jgi:NAD(P)-dependent dehydrogenase (short-subunit alcohol dehydrogenase family)
MKIVVIGGSGLIGSKLVAKLRERGYETLAASPKSGVNTLTGEGLAAALEGAWVVVDVSNSPSFEEAAVLEFFWSALATHDDPRTVVMDPRAGYFGAELGERTLLPGAGAILGETRYGDWLGRASSGK